MTLHKAYCPGCSGNKAIESMLCRGCRGIYGDYADWPAWLKFRFNDYRREAAQEQAADDVEYYDEDADLQDVDDSLLTRLGAEMHVSVRPKGDPWWADNGGEVDLPFAPYDDDETNRLYRAANGIESARG